MYLVCKNIFCLLLILFLAGCEGGGNFAPVTELRSNSFSHAQNQYKVQRGDTLYAIAFGYDVDFRQLAQLNHLPFPYHLRVGQVLYVPGKAHKAIIKSNPYRTSRVIPSYTRTSMVSSHSLGWQWPVRGHVATYFIPNQGKKGINIASQKGEKVRAALGGVVAYAGGGLAGYGNLIIIKHNNEYLTAYGNNAKNLVSEGQKVKIGQAIAEVGVIDHKYWGVHFEIRKMGIPVNPLNYLKKG